MALRAVTLEDKYALESGRVYLTGTQALVRLPMMQRRRDLAAGLNTAGFISGYRGSPLGGFDQGLARARSFLDRHHIRFQPAVNEELAATAVWGSQQVNLWAGSRYDGVFGLWYGKGPGVDRAGDAFKHANFAGTARHGGVLALAGDDHACKSSTVPHQSEHAFAAAMMPVLAPANVQDILDLGLHGWALSRYSGCWVGFKCVGETVDSSASVEVGPDRAPIVLPDDFVLPPGGLNIRWPDPPLVQEERLMRHKLYAALAYARANRLDRVVVDSPHRRFGIVTVGKSAPDVRQALDKLGLDPARAAALGVAVYQVAMPWPLEPHGARAFCEGLEEVLVVEEKRALVENQIKEQLYNWHADKRPTVVGKFDEHREWILPSTGELGPAWIAVAIGRRLLARIDDPDLAERVAFLEARERQKVTALPALRRTPFFCSGCPHNRSTVVPAGSRALAGIGCHYMAIWMDRATETFSQMGGEGAAWIGQAPFTDTGHVFANLGDGTYFHSGLLAIRAAVAAGVNITYKILFNDAVAMTGGQKVDGPLTVPALAQQVAAEGVARIAVVTEDPARYGLGTGLPRDTAVEPRDALDRVQAELRDVPGVTVLIYDQTCAAEKRRRRKRGTLADPAVRVVINERVCEGCGDCSAKSNCLSVVPVETEFGRKRAIDQSTCNKDRSCLDGFCPSFVTVEGGRLRKPAPAGIDSDAFADLPEPAIPEPGRVPYDILIAGIGGTGVVTVGALLGMAAHLDGHAVSVLDQTGLAQTGGAVLSHVRIAARLVDITAASIAAGGADLLLGGDPVVAAASEVLSRTRPGATRAVLNTHAAVTGEFTRNPDHTVPVDTLLGAIAAAIGAAGRIDTVDATRLATGLMGDAIATNLFLLGFAWQRGLVPVSAAALDRAIELNEASVDANRRALLWGRRVAHDPAAVERLVAPLADPGWREDHALAQSLDEAVDRRAAFLTEYQDAAYAARYRALVEAVRRAEQARVPAAAGRPGSLAEAVARAAFKLMAYKDEYEVARLHADPAFWAQIARQFEGEVRVRFHLAPPLLAARDPDTGYLKKRAYGPWLWQVFRVLARLKGLRGTRFDPFGRTAERRAERQAIVDYEALVVELCAGLDPGNHALAVEIAALPEQIRGYGHVKEANRVQVRAREAELLALFRAPPATRRAAE